VRNLSCALHLRNKSYAPARNYTIRILLPTVSPDELWQRATARWAEITVISPDLAPAVVLQQRLLRLIIDAGAGLDPSPLSGLATDSILAQWRRGIPALRNQSVIIPDALKELLPSLCRALADGGAADSALHILDALIDKRIDAGSLLSVSLARNQKAIRTSALHLGLAPDLVWLVGELGSGPLAHHLQLQLLERRGPVPTPSFQDWDRGYCPFCGSWPAFIESLAGLRTLRCSYCALAWTLQSVGCIYCGNTGDSFVSVPLDATRSHRSVELCAACGNYTKVIETSDPVPFPLLAIEDLATMDLDEAAMKREYRRPELYDLDSLEPFKSPC
jgi:Protein involved in formate dehydrogenase formation